MISKKILSIIIGIVIVGAGAGTYFVLSNQGYINPGIQITSFTSSSHTMLNNSLDMPSFTAHVDSSKTAEYEVLNNGNLLFSGSITGNQTLKLPDSLTQLGDLSNALSTVGLHNVTLKIVYNSYSTSKSIQVYTFPCLTFSDQHSYIDTGVSDTITASSYSDHLVISSPIASATDGPLTITPSSSGIINIDYSMSHGSFHFSGTAGQIQVYNPPSATGISTSNVTYTSGYNPYITFDLNMASTGGDVHSGLCYEIYVNGTSYMTIPSFSHSETYFIEQNGSGPFNVYFIIKDNYYSSTSSTITVYS